MFFLLRTTFWIAVLLAFIPFGTDPKSDGPNAKERATIDGMAALAAAGATISDVGGFCSRQPGACDVGQQALKVLGERAAAGATAVQSYLASEKSAAKPTPASVAAPETTASTAASRNTLSAADRKPAWRGPAA